MKKVMIIMATAVISLISCNKEVIDNAPVLHEQPETEIVFNLTAHHPDGVATKAVKTGWEDGDVIFVFFNNVAAPKYLKMTYYGAGWTYTQMNGASEESLGLADNASGTMTAIYLPFGSSFSVSASGTSFKFSTTTYSYYLTASIGYTVTDGVVSGTFEMMIPEGYIQFFLDDNGTPNQLELRERHLTPQGIASIAADGTITHTNIAMGAPLYGYIYDKSNKTGSDSRGYLFSGILADEARNTPTDYYFTLVVGGLYGTYYSKDFSGKTWYRGESEGRALKIPALNTWTQILTYKPIDMGTDVNGKRIYWSDRNLGASQPNDYGGYYAWGETEAKASFSNTNYKWLDAATYTITKYNTTDNKTMLELGENPGETVDDPARAQLGHGWRVPTNAEWTSLRSSANVVWNSQNGVAGCTITKGGGSIFLPAAGCRQGSTTLNATTKCQFWCAQIPGPTYLRIISYSSSSGTVSSSSGSYSYRFDHGFPVRPVCD